MVALIWHKYCDLCGLGGGEIFGMIDGNLLKGFFFHLSFFLYSGSGLKSKLFHIQMASQIDDGWAGNVMVSRFRKKVWSGKAG